MQIVMPRVQLEVHVAKDNGILRDVQFCLAREMVKVAYYSFSKT